MKLSSINMMLTQKAASSEIYGQKTNKTTGQTTPFASRSMGLNADTVTFTGGLKLYCEPTWLDVGIIEGIREDEVVDAITQIKSGKIFPKAYTAYKNSDKHISETYQIGNIKIQKSKQDDFSGVTEILKKKPYDMRHSEELLARVEENGYYYLFTQVPPSEEILPRNFFNQEIRDFQNLIPSEAYPEFMNSLFSLDKAGIYHNIVSYDHGNISIGQDGVVISNYADAKLFKPEDRLWNCPPFMMPSNALDFESKTLGEIIDGLKYMETLRRTDRPKGYLFEIDEAESLDEYIYLSSGFEKPENYFRNYLMAKSDYHAQRAEYIEQTTDMTDPLNKKAHRYETLEAKFTKKPSDSVIDYEHGKIKIQSHHVKGFLSQSEDTAFAAANSITDRINGILTALEVIKKADNEPICGDKDYEEYVDFQKQFAQFWLDNTLQWAIEYVGLKNNINPKLSYKNSKIPNADERFGEARHVIQALLIEAKNNIADGNKQQATEALAEAKEIAQREKKVLVALDNALKKLEDSNALNEYNGAVANLLGPGSGDSQ